MTLLPCAGRRLGQSLSAAADGGVMYELLIANKNYSSWSVRPWVLMTALGIPFKERMTPFPAPLPAGPLSRASRRAARCPASSTTAPGLGFARHRRVSRRAAPGVWPADAKARAWARSASAEMHSGFATLRNICNMNCGIRVRIREVSPGLAGRHRTARGALERGAQELRRAIPRGSRFHERRCLLLSRRFPRADLRAAA